MRMPRLPRLYRRARSIAVLPDRVGGNCGFAAGAMGRGDLQAAPHHRENRAWNMKFV